MCHYLKHNFNKGNKKGLHMSSTLLLKTNMRDNIWYTFLYTCFQLIDSKNICVFVLQRKLIFIKTLTIYKYLH